MAANNFSPQLETALNQRVLARLPITFLPYVNQQLHQWEFLFPNERKSVERLLLLVVRLNAGQSSALFRDIVALEEKMDVRHWPQFSTTEQTIQNSSQLARSPYFQEWRRAVQSVFDAADRSAQETTPQASSHRLILLEIPKPLPLSATIWRRWQSIGKPIQLSLDSAPSAGPLRSLLTDSDATSNASQGLLTAARSRPNPTLADTWVIDGGRELIDALDTHPAPSASILLSYLRLDDYRQNFTHEMHSMRQDLADADAVFDRLRQVDVSPWCPHEVAADAAVREFVRSLYLSGNGAVIFGNSFVEWAASEAFRRARPSFLAARFGVRSKPKPFTGVAVFDDPNQVNPLPAVDDLSGSAIDAEILAAYIWLSAIRYPEFKQSTVCVCIAGSIAEAYVVAPPEFSLRNESGPMPAEAITNSLQSWLS